MFVIAVNDRESYSYASLTGALTVEGARQKLIDAWLELYDTSTAVLVKFEGEVATTVFRADTDGQDYLGDSVAIAEGYLEDLDEALAPYTTA